MSLIADTAVKFLDAFLIYETVKIYQSSTIDTVNPSGSDIGIFFSTIFHWFARIFYKQFENRCK